MANIFLAWQNRIDEATLSGGSWLSSLPITNMQDRQIQKVARTSNATLAATQFDIDLGVARPIGVLALVNHNISVGGLVKISGAPSLASFVNQFTTFTNDFSNAAWTKGNVSVTPNSSIVFAPDGTATASQILGLSIDFANIYRDVSLPGTSTVTHNIYLKAGSQSLAAAKISWLGGGAGNTQTASCSINLATGEVTNVSGSASSIAAWATDAGNGWWRLTLTGVGTNAANNTVRFEFEVVGSKSIFAWGAFLSNAAAVTYESPFIEVWPAGILPIDLLEWDEDNFWLGTITQDQRTSYQSPFIHKLPEPDTARYWRVQVYDTANPDGYIQIGRLFMARGWTPAINYVYGAGLGYEDITPVERSLSGAEYFDIRPKFRVMRFTLDYIEDTDAYSFALDLERVAGISGEVLIIPDGGEDPARQSLISYLGRLRTLSPIRHAKPTAYSVPFEVKELL